MARLREIEENCLRIVAYSAHLDFARFEADHLRRDAIERCIERVSEAAKKLGTKAEEIVPGQPWAAIRAVGNILRHQYDEIAPDVVGRIAVEDVPRLPAAVRIAVATGPTDET